jgi:ADP-heptose:LPS heptosyltransferase
MNGGGYVCVHPGATAGPRRWSPAGFVQIADALADAGLTVFFTGRAFETDLIAGIQRLMRREAIDLSGRTSLGALAALVEDASLVVCNDTGVSHLAAALRVPSVVVFAGTTSDGSDPRRWAPLDSELHVVVAREKCTRAVPVSRVLQAVGEQLGRRSRERDLGRWRHEQQPPTGRPGQLPGRHGAQALQIASDAGSVDV